MNRRVLGGAMGIVALILAGCSRTGVTESETAPSLGDLQTVRLHFTTFSKSKSGATWMAWPNTVTAALEGFASISDIRVDLERDDIVVTYDGSEISIDELLEACNDSGFPATVAAEPRAQPEKKAEAGQDPEFFLAALATAKREAKPLVLDFSAEWCAPCQRMIREVFPDPKVATLLESFVFLTIDTDAYPALAQKYRVVGMPDIRILSPEGKEIRQVLGFHDAESFAAALQSSLEPSGSAGAATGSTAVVEE